MTETKREKFLRGIIRIIFAVYILLLTRFILFKYAPLSNLGIAFFLRRREYNLVPLKATLEMVRGLSPLRLVENIAGNIILFVPFGVLLPLAFKVERLTVVYGCAASVFVEVVQFAFAMGAADIDDVILNTLGAAVGYAAYRVIRHFFKSREKLLAAMAVLLSAGLIAGVIVLYFAGYLVDGFPNIIFD
ncbi:MAG: VanZ family protein [Prevotella sp.]|nr:VanZ family protein [Prevotella sp.]